jgi:putative DNA primase/helicase
VDEAEEIKELAKKTVRWIYNEAYHHDDVNKRQDLSHHAYKSESSHRISSMINLAQSDSNVAIRPDEFDKDIFLLNCANGVLDLRTGHLGPHQKEDYLTKMIHIEFDEDSACPQWLAFLEKIMNGNADLIGFLQRATGYALTGDCSEQCLFILFGSGANGKSTFLRTVGFLTGDYGQQTATETLLVKQKGAIPNDIARLKGARFITASEAEAEQRLAESLIKQMTGNDIISARFLHQEWFDFEPTYKIFIGTNHKPVIKGTDYAIWRRIRLIPFEVTIPENERDRMLLNKLKGELPGILAWAVKGCLDWQKKGLGSPQAIVKATAEYRNEMDIVCDFLTECCETGQNFTVLTRDLYKAYKEWCESNGDTLLKKNAFGSSLGEKGFVPRRFGKGLRGWEGLMLKSA